MENQPGASGSMGIFPEVWASVRVTLGLVDNSSDDFPNATFLEVKDYIMKKQPLKKLRVI